MKTKHLFFDWLDEIGGLFLGSCYVTPDGSEADRMSFELEDSESLALSMGRMVRSVLLSEKVRGAAVQESERDIRDRLLSDYEQRMEKDPSLIPTLTNPLWLKTQLHEIMRRQSLAKGASLSPEGIVLVMPRPVSGLARLLTDTQVSMWRSNDPLDIAERRLWADIRSIAKEADIRLFLIEHMSEHPCQKPLRKAVMDFQQECLKMAEAS